MRNTLAFLAAAVIAVGAVGYYLDWFSVRTRPTKDGHRKIVVDVNADKISESAHKIEHAVEDKLAEKAKKEKESVAPAKMPEVEEIKVHRASEHGPRQEVEGARRRQQRPTHGDQ
jgi:hypothetical protein